MIIKPLDVFVVNNPFITLSSMWKVYLVLDSRQVSKDYTDLFYVEIGHTYKLGVDSQTGILSMDEPCNHGIAKFSRSICRSTIAQSYYISVVGKLDEYSVDRFLKKFFNPKRFSNPNIELLEKAFKYFSVAMNNSSESTEQLSETYKINDSDFGFGNNNLGGTIEFELSSTTEKGKPESLDNLSTKSGSGHEDKNDQDDKKKQCENHKYEDYESSRPMITPCLQPPSQEDIPSDSKPKQKYYSTVLFKCNDYYIPDEARMIIQKYGITDTLEEMNMLEEKFVRSLDNIVNNTKVAKLFIEEYRSMSIERFCKLYRYSKKDAFKIIEAIILKYKVR